MRVLHVIETLSVGGAERVLLQLLPALRTLGIEGELAVLRPPYTLAGQLESDGFIVHRMDRENMWNLPSGASALGRLALDRSCPIVHANLFFPTVYAGLAKKMFRGTFRTLTTFHNLAYAPGANRRGPTYSLRKQLNRWNARLLMDKKLAVSAAVASHYAGALGVYDIEVVHNPVTINEVLSAVHGRKLTWPIDDNGARARLILPGRLVPEKGHLDLIDALAMLADKGFHFSTVFAGDGPLYELLSRRINTSGIPIHLTGGVSRGDFLRLMKASDITVIPSRFEGFGLTAAEALVLRRAVVATRVGGLSEIVQDAESGLLVSPCNPYELAQAIDQLSGDAELRELLAANGAAHVIANYDTTIVSTRIAKIYQELIQSN